MGEYHFRSAFLSVEPPIGVFLRTLVSLILLPIPLLVHAQDSPNSASSSFSDFGASGGWIRQDLPSDIFDMRVCFIDENRGWVTGGGLVYATTDGGISWTESLYDPTYHHFDVCFVDSMRGWLCGLWGNILVTTDGGENWTPQPHEIPFDLYSIVFADSLSGWAVGDDQTIIHTGDGGNYWWDQTVPSIHWGAILDVFFIDKYTGWASGEDGDIFHTTNEGLTWVRQESGLDRSISGIHFIDNMIGWAVVRNATHATGGGTILKTTNGGSTWVELDCGTDRNLYDVVFINENSGWAVGGALWHPPDSSIILATTDGGLNWQVQSASDARAFFQIDMVDSATGWTTGTESTILHTTTGGTTWVDGEKPSLPQDYLLQQNYPNPFNPSTTIEYSVPERSHVRLEIFNMVGELVAVLKDGLEEAGNHSVVFHADHLPSGVYVYRLRAGEFTGARVLLLLK